MTEDKGHIFVEYTTGAMVRMIYTMMKTLTNKITIEISTFSLEVMFQQQNVVTNPSDKADSHFNGLTNPQSIVQVVHDVIYTFAIHIW